jgi:hypothetical protein
MQVGTHLVQTRAGPSGSVFTPPWSAWYLVSIVLVYLHRDLWLALGRSDLLRQLKSLLMASCLLHKPQYILSVIFKSPSGGLNEECDFHFNNWVRKVSPSQSYLFIFI